MQVQRERRRGKSAQERRGNAVPKRDGNEHRRFRGLQCLGQRKLVHAAMRHMQNREASVRRELLDGRNAHAAAAPLVCHVRRRQHLHGPRELFPREDVLERSARKGVCAAEQDIVRRPRYARKRPRVHPCATHQRRRTQHGRSAYKSSTHLDGIRAAAFSWTGRTACAKNASCCQRRACAESCGPPALWTVCRSETEWADVDGPARPAEAAPGELLAFLRAGCTGALFRLGEKDQASEAVGACADGAVRAPAAQDRAGRHARSARRRCARYVVWLMK